MRLPHDRPRIRKHHVRATIVPAAGRMMSQLRRIRPRLGPGTASGDEMGGDIAQMDLDALCRVAGSTRSIRSAPLGRQTVRGGSPEPQICDENECRTPTRPLLSGGIAGMGKTPCLLSRCSRSSLGDLAPRDFEDNRRRSRPPRDSAPSRRSNPWIQTSGHRTAQPPGGLANHLLLPGAPRLIAKDPGTPASPVPPAVRHQSFQRPADRLHFRSIPFRARLFSGAGSSQLGQTRNIAPFAFRWDTAGTDPRESIDRWCSLRILPLSGH